MNVYFCLLDCYVHNNGNNYFFICSVKTSFVTVFIFDTVAYTFRSDSIIRFNVCNIHVINSCVVLSSSRQLNDNINVGISRQNNIELHSDGLSNSMSVIVSWTYLTNRLSRALFTLKMFIITRSVCFLLSCRAIFNASFTFIYLCIYIVSQEYRALARLYIIITK